MTPYAVSDPSHERLLTALAHELRTPLTAIRGFAALLQSLDASNDDGVRRELTARLVRNAVQMEAVLDSMLDAARDGRLETFHPQSVNLHSNVLDVVDAISPALEEHAVNVRGAMTYAFVDPYVLTRILARLLSNAARYSPPGSRIEIETTKVDDGFVRMTISDAGPGIPAPDRANAFAPYWRGDSARQDVRGLGVGLAIAQDLCLRSGGTLALLDSPDGGATVEVVLPSHP